MKIDDRPFVSFPSGRLIPRDVVDRMANDAIMQPDDYRIWLSLCDEDVLYFVQEWSMIGHDTR